MSYHMRIADAVDRLRQPEHTGEDRCTPCTVVNLLIAVAIAGVVTVLSPWLAIAAFVAFVGTIYLRGYLVPGTPSLTKRYLPARVLRLFGKEPIERSFDGGAVTSAEYADSNPETAETDGVLAAAGVVSRTEEADIDLTPGFKDEWRERIQTTRERTLETEDVREMLDADSVSRHGNQSFVVDGNKSVRWGSNAAFVADIAAASILDERLDEWDSFEWDRKRSVFLGLRLCLERCPSCDGTVETSENRADPCCQKPHRMAQSICGNCGAAIADAAVVDHGEGESVQLRLLQP
jgi:hypothetical protein